MMSPGWYLLVDNIVSVNFWFWLNNEGIVAIERDRDVIAFVWVLIGGVNVQELIRYSIELSFSYDLNNILPGWSYDLDKIRLFIVKIWEEVLIKLEGIVIFSKFAEMIEQLEATLFIAQVIDEE